MSSIENLKPSITEMSTAELQDLLAEIRGERRNYRKQNLEEKKKQSISERAQKKPENLTKGLTKDQAKTILQLLGKLKETPNAS